MTFQMKNCWQEKDKIKLPQQVQSIITTLHDAGFRAYAVGGCVRDALLGKDPHDWDICTNASPDKIQHLFSKTIPTGLQHGTVTVVLPDASQYEVTTFRKDGLYTDSRHPDSVTFVDNILDDLSRRDFTINSMAYDGETLIDPFGGRSDLQSHTIRCVGNPSDRFREDPLRILRAIRFSSTLRFRIDNKTEQAMWDIHRDISKVSNERIYAELNKTLLGKDCMAVLERYGEIIGYIIPELERCYNFDQKSQYHIYDVYTHSLCALDNYKGDDLITKWALLLHDTGKPDCCTEDEKGRHFHGHPEFSAQHADDVMRRMHADNHTRSCVVELVALHDNRIEPTGKYVKRWLNKIGPEQFGRLMDIQLADSLAHTPGSLEDKIERIAQARIIAEDVQKEMECFSLKDLDVNGRDLMEIGMPAGPELGRLLGRLLECVIDGVVENEKSALLGTARELVGLDWFER